MRQDCDFFIMIVDDVVLNHKILSKILLSKLNIIDTNKNKKKNIYIINASNAINAITIVYERYINKQPIDLILLDNDLSKSPHGDPVILSTNKFFNSNKNILTNNEIVVGYKQKHDSQILKDIIYKLGDIEIKTEETYNTGYDIILNIRNLYNGPIFSISSHGLDKYRDIDFLIKNSMFNFIIGKQEPLKMVSIIKNEVNRFYTDKNSLFKTMEIHDMYNDNHTYKFTEPSTDYLEKYKNFLLEYRLCETDKYNYNNKIDDDYNNYNNNQEIDKFKYSENEEQQNFLKLTSNNIFNNSVRLNCNGIFIKKKDDLSQNQLHLSPRSGRTRSTHTRSTPTQEYHIPHCNILNVKTYKNVDSKIPEKKYNEIIKNEIINNDGSTVSPNKNKKIKNYKNILIIEYITKHDNIDNNKNSKDSEENVTNEIKIPNVNNNKIPKNNIINNICKKLSNKILKHKILPSR